MSIAEYVCPGKCCEVTVRLANKRQVNQSWVISVDGEEHSMEAWALQLKCSKSRIRHRIELEQCLRSKSVYRNAARYQAQNKGNDVGKGCKDAANLFLRLRFRTV